MPKAHMKSAPDLATAGSRLTQEFLEAYIANPSQTQPGTTMPNVLPKEKSQGLAKAIAAYLRSLKPSPAPEISTREPR